MEIFSDGELERELQRSGLNGGGLLGWWRVFSETYEELIQSIAQPTRAEYALSELGPTVLDLPNADGESVEVEREDIQLTNSRGERLECSFWRRKGDQQNDAAVPCVLYLHGMSSSRKESVYLRRKVLASGFSLFALDFSGAGKSQGDRVSFGCFERDDVRVALDFLYATGKATRVAIWGRDIGAVAALLHLQDRFSYQYETMELSADEMKAIEIVEDKGSNQLLCIRQPAGRLTFRMSKYSAQNGDFAVLAVDSEPVGSKSAIACRKMIELAAAKRREIGSDNQNGSGDEPVRLAGYKRSSAGAASQDQFVFALVADNAYADMEQVIWDMLQMISKSAERRSLAIPGPMVTAIQKLLTNSIGRAGGYNLRDVGLLDAAPQFTLPCMFICASKKDFFTPDHTMALLEKYGGPKSFVQFTGLVDDNRPDDVLDSVMNHFTERLKLL